MISNLTNPQTNIFSQYSWGEKTANFICGCCNNCSYCYAQSNAIRRNEKTAETWKEEVVNQEDLNCPVHKCVGRFMYPSKHDISPQHINEHIFMIGKILKTGNSLFCITKPHYECIERICKAFSDYKDKIEFCFTIGSTNPQTLAFWESNASTFQERVECLRMAYNQGFTTSVSAEPLLDRNLNGLVEELTPFVTRHLWFGKMNYPIKGLTVNGHRDTETMKRVKNLINFHNDANFIRYYYNRFKDNPKIQWKSHFRKEILNDTTRFW
jgi:DNA repair photolyase